MDGLKRDDSAMVSFFSMIISLDRTPPLFLRAREGFEARGCADIPFPQVQARGILSPPPCLVRSRQGCKVYNVAQAIAIEGGNRETSQGGKETLGMKSGTNSDLGVALSSGKSSWLSLLIPPPRTRDQTGSNAYTAVGNRYTLSSPRPPFMSLACNTTVPLGAAPSLASSFDGPDSFQTSSAFAFSSSTTYSLVRLAVLLPDGIAQMWTVTSRGLEHAILVELTGMVILHILRNDSVDS